MGANRARQLAHAQLVATELEATAVAAHLGHEHGHFVAERRRLGVDAMAAADRQRVLVAHRQLGQDGLELAQILGQDVRRFLNLQ